MVGYPTPPDNAQAIEYSQDGRRKRTTATFYRGPNAHFHPTDESLGRDRALADYALLGWTPAAPFISTSTPLVAFGSCFAANISNYLHDRHYNVLTKKSNAAYVSTMGDGIVNTYAIRQQFEWAWEQRQPSVELWHGYDARAFGYDEPTRLETRALFDAADVFVITLGLSEVWYDEPTGEVFWRAVPADRHDPARHRFRVTTVEENQANLAAIDGLIRRHRPDARLIVTLSPVPLTATFRNVSCVTANAVSKAILRVAIDQFLRARDSSRDDAFYFPSYEIVTTLFQNAFMEDRKHPHQHVLDLNMKTFERFFCVDGSTDCELSDAFARARILDRQVGVDGHFSVPRTANPPAGGAVRPLRDSAWRSEHAD